MATKRTKEQPKPAGKPAVIFHDTDDLVPLETPKKMYLYKRKLELEGFRKRFQAGNRKELFGVIRFCALHEIPLPIWAASEFITGYDKVDNLEVDSWDKAFGSPYPKGTHLSRMQQARQKIPAVWVEVEYEKIMKGSSVNQELFERVGNKLGIGKTRAQELYYQAKRLIGDDWPRRFVGDRGWEQVAMLFDRASRGPSRKKK